MLKRPKLDFFKTSTIDFTHFNIYTIKTPYTQKNTFIQEQKGIL